MLLQDFGFLQCFQNMGYRQRLQQWAFFNTKKKKKKSNEKAISVCMHALVGLETLRDRV